MILGKRMAASNVKFDRVVMSTLNRATETALLMLQQMPEENVAQTQSDSIIEEGAPYPPEPEVRHWRPRHKVRRLRGRKSLIARAVGVLRGRRQD